MVNWTRPVINSKKTKDYDLPIPFDIHDCNNLINEVDDLLGLFESDDLWDDYEYHVSTGIDLLSGLDPASVAASSYSKVWEDEVKMWLFAEEIIRCCRYDSDDDRKNFLISVCQDYLKRLYDRHTELGGKIKDIK